MKIKLCAFAVIISLSDVFCAANLTADSFPNLTNLTFYLRSQSDYHPQSRFRSDEEIFYTVAPIGTIRIYHRWLPAEQTFDFKLLDEAGREIPKTESGKSNSQTVKLPQNKLDISKLKPHVILNDSRKLFRPDEMFALTNKGVYELQVQIRLCTPMTNNLPDYQAITNNPKFVTSKKFGIVLSEPVRVKIIKE